MIQKCQITDSWHVLVTQLACPSHTLGLIGTKWDRDKPFFSAEMGLC